MTKWEYYKDGNRYHVVDSLKKVPVCEVDHESDAKLICMANEFVRACKSYVMLTEFVSKNPDAIGIATALDDIYNMRNRMLRLLERLK